VGGSDAGGPGPDGAGGADAKEPDGASDSGDGGASGCAASTRIVCEDFESTAVGAIPMGWTRVGATSLSGVDAAQAARGIHSLKLDAVANGPRRITFPAASFGSAHWGRIFYKVQTPAPTPASNVVHSTLVALAGANPQGPGSEEVRVVDTVENTQGLHQFIYNVQPQGPEFGTGSAYNWRYDGVWHCAEWHIDAGNQSYQFFFDGTEITQIAKANGAGNFNGTGIPSVFTSIAVGWYNYQAVSPGFVAWIDEIAIDANRIGCGN
jgi:hypothetical protein